jgi:hypothetical protein
MQFDASSQVNLPSIHKVILTEGKYLRAATLLTCIREEVGSNLDGATAHLEELLGRKRSGSSL